MSGEIVNVGGSLALIIGAVILVAERFSLLERLRLVKPKAVDAMQELALADRAANRLRRDLAEATAANAELVKTRSFEPILDQLATNAELQRRVIDRLVHHNGSFKAMEKSLGEICGSLQLVSEGMRTLTEFIMSEVPSAKAEYDRPPRRRR